MTAPPLPSRSGLVLLVFALACLAQAGLVLNPGYFSHDELQWGAAADVASWRDLPWLDWTDIRQLQWRPLTFNAWLLISHVLFETPKAFHGLWVILGSAIAAALALLVRRLDTSPGVALAAGLVFALNPYAAYVHGWVATLADLVWVGCALAVAHALLSFHRRGGRNWAAALLAFVLTAVGLLAKESALSIPALVALAWLLLGRGPVLRAAMLASVAAAAIYLFLRLGVLLAPDPASGYDFTPWEIPRNWAAYWNYLPRPELLEVGTTWLDATARILVSALLGLSAVAVVTRRSPRLAAMLVFGGTAALLPALPLPMAATQYGYGFSAWTVACFALAWPGLGRPGRALVLVLALLVAWHGVNVQRGMRAVGERQAVFQPALVEALRRHEGKLRLLPEARYAWAYVRLTNGVPAWRGELIGDRVQIVGDVGDADFLVGEDGDLRRVE